MPSQRSRTIDRVAQHAEHRGTSKTTRRNVEQKAEHVDDPPRNQRGDEMRPGCPTASRENFVKPRYLRGGGFIAGVAAMCVLLFDLHIAWFVVAAFALVICSLGAFALERKQRHPDP